MEMTGLDPEQNVVLEIATIVTDKDLNVLAEGLSSPSTRATQSWPRWTSGTSTPTPGRPGGPGQGSEYDEARAIAENAGVYLGVGARRTSPLCGNSIGQDRRFAGRSTWRSWKAFFRYRNVDVSTIQELVRRWQPGCWSSSKKSGSHLGPRRHPRIPSPSCSSTRAHCI